METGPGGSKSSASENSSWTPCGSLWKESNRSAGKRPWPCSKTGCHGYWQSVIGNLRNSVRLRELEDEGLPAEMGGPQFSPAETRPSGELRRTGTKHSCCPIGVRQCTGRQSFQLFVQVVFDPPNGRNIPIQHQIRCTRVAVIWKSDTPGIHKEFGNDARLSNER